MNLNSGYQSKLSNSIIPSTRITPLPQIEWVSEIVEAADKAGIPVFLKDNLRDLIWTSGSPEWAFNNNEIRQEMPEVKG